MSGFIGRTKDRWVIRRVSPSREGGTVWVKVTDRKRFKAFDDTIVVERARGHPPTVRYGEVLEWILQPHNPATIGDNLLAGLEKTAESRHVIALDSATKRLLPDSDEVSASTDFVKEEEIYSFLLEQLRKINNDITQVTNSLRSTLDEMDKLEAQQ